MSAIAPGERSHLRLEQLRERRFAGIFALGGVPLHQHFLQFPLRHKRQRAQSLRRVPHDRVQQHSKMLRHPGNSVRVKQRGAVFDPAGKSFRRFFQTAIADRVCRFDYEFPPGAKRSPPASISSMRPFFVIKHHLENRRVARIAFQLQLHQNSFEQQRVIRQRAARAFANATQELAKTRIAARIASATRSSYRTCRSSLPDPPRWRMLTFEPTTMIGRTGVT